MAKDDKYQQDINKLKEEIKLLKQSKSQQHHSKTGMYRNNTNSKPKKGEQCFCVSRRPTSKCRTNHCHQLHRRNHENFVRLQRKTENTTRLQFDPTGQVINLRNKRFSKETFKLLKKT